MEMWIAYSDIGNVTQLMYGGNVFVIGLILNSVCWFAEGATR